MTSLPHDHLDDEALSAVLDGEATPDETAHTASCAECGARLAALREASMLVRSPVAPAPDAQRDVAIAAALAAATPSNVVSLASRRRGVPAWLGAAAAVVVAVVAIGVVAGRAADDDDSADVASGGAGGDTTTEMAADDAGESLSTLAAAPVEGGDLGAIEDIDLQLVVDGALARREVAETTVADADEESDGGDDESTETTIPSAAGSAPAAAGCEDPVRAGDPELGALVYRATGTYDDEAAVVLGFDVVREDGGVDRRVYVLAVEGCAIRLAETYSA